MSREIKFRAWHKENKVMHLIFDSTNGTEWFLPNVNERYEVMQYTGLTDKNGVEIYEGDIVEITTFSYHEPLNMMITTVNYSENRASFVFGETEPQLCYRSLDEIADDAYTFQTLVIGNIYESERESK